MGRRGVARGHAPSVLDKAAFHASVLARIGTVMALRTHKGTALPIREKTVGVRKPPRQRPREGVVSVFGDPLRSCTRRPGRPAHAASGAARHPNHAPTRLPAIDRIPCPYSAGSQRQEILACAIQQGCGAKAALGLGAYTYAGTGIQKGRLDILLQSAALSKTQKSIRCLKGSRWFARCPIEIRLSWVCGLGLCAGLALSGGPAAHAQVTDHQLAGQNDPANPLRTLPFDTQAGLRIEPPARGGSQCWYRVRFNAAGTAPSGAASSRPPSRAPSRPPSRLWGPIWPSAGKPATRPTGSAPLGPVPSRPPFPRPT